MATSRWSYWNGTQEVEINAPSENSEGVKIGYKLTPVYAGTTTASPALHAARPDSYAVYPGNTYPGTIYPGGE